LTLAETASVFGEMLTFRALLRQQTDPRRRKIMLAGKVEDMLNTVVRQIAFVSFEQRVHEERRDAELTPDRLGEIWLDVQRESLGPALRLDGVYRHYWSYIPHFVHTPFYVYAYAFGDCLVNSLYAVYEDAHQGFAERYLEMLRAGGTMRHREPLPLRRAGHVGPAVLVLARPRLHHGRFRELLAGFGSGSAGHAEAGRRVPVLCRSDPDGCPQHSRSRLGDDPAVHGPARPASRR